MCHLETSENFSRDWFLNIFVNFLPEKILTETMTSFFWVLFGAMLLWHHCQFLCIGLKDKAMHFWKQFVLRIFLFSVSFYTGFFLNAHNLQWAPKHCGFLTQGHFLLFISTAVLFCTVIFLSKFLGRKMPKLNKNQFLDKFLLVSKGHKSYRKSNFSCYESLPWQR